MTVITKSNLTCPKCGCTKERDIPEGTWKVLHFCSTCGAEMSPGKGECCVFCAFGDVPCICKQREQSESD